MSFSGRTRSALLLLSSEGLVIGGKESLSWWCSGGDEKSHSSHPYTVQTKAETQKTFPVDRDCRPFSLTGTNPPEIQESKGGLVPSLPSPVHLAVTKGISSNEFQHRDFPQAVPPAPLPEALPAETRTCSVPAPSQGHPVSLKQIRHLDTIMMCWRLSDGRQGGHSNMHTHHSFCVWTQTLGNQVWAEGWAAVHSSLAEIQVDCTALGFRSSDTWLELKTMKMCTNSLSENQFLNSHRVIEP